MELVATEASSGQEVRPQKARLRSKQARSLYVSHALSTWNARTYEAAAIFFTAAAWPDTLLMSSLRGLFTTSAVLLCSSYIGQAIGRSDNRLYPLTCSIVGGRTSIILACFGWMLLLSDVKLDAAGAPFRTMTFVFVIIAGIGERLTAIANTITMERDWVPVLADEDEDNAGGAHTLTALNSIMRRIDLSCKLFSPLLISLTIVATSTVTGVWLVLAMNVLGLGLEWISAKYVWDTCPQLQHKLLETESSQAAVQKGNPVSKATGVLRQQGEQLRTYFSSDVWLPSLALALLHLSALSYAATFVTFLLASGFSLLIVTVARTVGSIAEVSSTYMVPYGVHRLSHVHSKTNESNLQQQQSLMSEDEDVAMTIEHVTGVARSGLWGLSLQLASLVPVIFIIFQIVPDSGVDASNPLLLPKRLLSILEASGPAIISIWAAISMFGFLSMSRLGLWTFDLTTQELTQSLVSPSERSSFAGSEMSFVALFELAQWIFAAIFNKPQQFKWLALGSGGAVFISSAMYAYWVRQRRGHLLHWEHLNTDCCKISS